MSDTHGVTVLLRDGKAARLRISQRRDLERPELFEDGRWIADVLWQGLHRKPGNRFSEFEFGNGDFTRANPAAPRAPGTARSSGVA